MKRGLSFERGYDFHERPVTIIKKQRGKLTLEEVEEVLRYGGGGLLNGHYAIILNCSEASCGVNGWMDDEEPEGDAVTIYPLEEGEFCPVCGELTPPFRYCPTCGTSWKDMEDTVEKRLAFMRREAEHSIETATTPETKTAWYWSHIGAIDFARLLDFITDDRRKELYKEIEHLKPVT